MLGYLLLRANVCVCVSLYPAPSHDHAPDYERPLKNQLMSEVGTAAGSQGERKGQVSGGMIAMDGFERSSLATLGWKSILSHDKW